MKKRYYIFCDESIKKGKLFSNFYGGAMIDSKDFKLVSDVLEEKRVNILQTSELKWQKINKQNYKHYIDSIDTFFDFIQANKIKIRIMFTNNRFVKPDLKEEHLENEYLLLYYQFLKHSFGLRFLSPNDENHLELFLDKIPDTKENCKKFKEYLLGLQFLPDFLDSNIKISEQQISEVDSRNHIIMQNLDVVLGAMSAKLNKAFNEINIETGKRGNRTIAKEKVYKHINNRIRLIYPNFNIGITTGKQSNFENILIMPYRHWVFMGKNSVLRE
ncbi:DUF3800 domain-containing protein [Chryseobacterium aquaticum]|uniref:DUF3800 domain-containing protein n=1 Tax=Chryseobacterium aquaticum TaxID=452084 RepID=UPI002FC9B0A5